MNRSSKVPLEIAIIWLERLIDSGEKKEASYQEFFEKNPVVFTVLGYRSFHTFTKESGMDLPRDEHTGLKPEPDFMVEREDGLYEIFEIKTPFAKRLRVDSNRYREKFTAEVNSYISQTITYEKYFTRNPYNRQRVKDLYGLDIQEDLDIKIVIGLNNQVEKVKVHQKARESKYKVDIVTYDDILRHLINEHDRHFAGSENLPGRSIHFMVRFRDQSTKQKRYFLDVGKSSDKNRVSVYLDEYDDVCFDVIDNVGKRYQVRIDAGEEQILNEWVYLVCEFGRVENGFVMSIAVNGSEKDKRVKGTDVEIAVPLRDVIVGCDLEKENFCRFDLAEWLSYLQTLSFRDKHQVFEYFTRKYSEDLSLENYIEFDGRRFMRMNKEGDLIQEKEEFKPLFRTADSGYQRDKPL